MKRARILAPWLLIAVTAVTGHATTIFNISGTTGDPLADAAFDPDRKCASATSR